jgi:hypothetical protein
MPQIVERQTRPLDETYPFVFMDAVHYKVREDGHIITKAAYVVLGINLEGNKEILGIWIGGGRNFQVLAVRAERTEKPWYQDSAPVLRGWPDRLPGSYRSGFPQSANPALHYPLNQIQQQVRKLEGY